MQGRSMTVKNLKYFVYLHIILALFSVSALFSKFAAGEKALSPKWLIYYAGILVIMFIYAIAWQQIIKHMPIVTAYANKAATVIWGLIWGFLIFRERITITKVIGALIIIAGVYLVVTGDDPDDLSSGEDEDDAVTGKDMNVNTAGEDVKS